MSLSTTQYGYIVDPMVPFTDDKGKTIKNGFIRVFMAGTSTPVITYRNYDGATNQEKIELDNSGRVKHNVIGSKGSLYKVVVYNILHSQENPLLTVDKIAVLGASVTGTTVVTGLDSVTVQEENFIKATVEGTGVELALDPTEVTSDVNTISAAETAAPDYVLPLLDKTGTGDGKKISLANLFKFALDWISRLATTVTSFASGDFIAVSNTTNGARKMSKDTLLELTAQNALAGNVAPAFDPTRTSDNPYKAGESVAYEGKTYTFKVDHYGAWSEGDVYQGDIKTFDQIIKRTKNLVCLAPKNLATNSGLKNSVGYVNLLKISGTTTNSGNNDILLDVVFPFSVSAGKYAFSVSGTFTKTGTASVYFLTAGNSSICYNSINDGKSVLDVTSPAVVAKILIRFFNVQTVSVDGNVQVEAGSAKTSFEGFYSANDFELNGKVKIIDETINNRVVPIFNNGVISSGIPDYSNYASCIQWLVTQKIYHVKKGSYIKYVGSKNVYLVIAKFVNGEFVSNIVSSNFADGYYFNEDMDVRLAIRFTDYSAIVPADASEIEFNLYSNYEQKNDLEIYFIGIGSGLNNSSGYAIIVKLPNGKNLVVDSHLLSYYNAFANALRNAGVRKIDYYVQTHYHGDHIGILNILQYYSSRVDIEKSIAFLPPEITVENIAQVVATGDNPQTLVDRQDALIGYLESNDCTIIRPNNTTDYDLGGDVKLRFYNTDHSIYSNPNSGYYSTNYNDWSICPQLIFGMNVVNLSSDIGPIGEHKVAGTLLKANILTAPHHGWDNGVNNLVPAFINNVSPDVVISVNGSEHHPDNTESAASVIKKTSAMQSYCEANAVPNYLTCLNGPIKVVMNENTWKFDGTYSRYIRNDKNWSYTNNSEHIEN